MKIAICGATGRMGRALVRLAHEDPALEIVGGVCSADCAEVGRDLGELAGVGTLGIVAMADIGSALLGADVVIDFSNAGALPSLIQVLERRPLPLVSGTTGLSEATAKALSELARKSAVLWAANTSLGVQVLAELVAQALRRLGPGYDVELVEVHHRRKVDAPSGTALRLVRAMTEVRPDLHDKYGREGNAGPRSNSELGVLALRGGDVIGDHTVHFLGPGERLELTHRATSRDLFAQGALRAAEFVQRQPPGFYSMADVLAGAPRG